MRGGRPQGFVRQMVFLLSGPLVWAGHFSLVYGAVGFGGAFGFTSSAMGNFTWGVTLAAIFALLALLWKAKARGARSGDPGFREMARAAAAISLWAVLLQALVLFIVPL